MLCVLNNHAVIPHKSILTYRRQLNPLLSSNCNMLKNAGSVCRQESSYSTSLRCQMNDMNRSDSKFNLQLYFYGYLTLSSYHIGIFAFLGTCHTLPRPSSHHFSMFRHWLFSAWCILSHSLKCIHSLANTFFHRSLNHPFILKFLFKRNPSGCGWEERVMKKPLLEDLHSDRTKLLLAISFLGSVPTQLCPPQGETVSLILLTLCVKRHPIVT